MKQTKLILITILSGVFLLLGAVLILGITGHGFFRGNWGNIGVNTDDFQSYTKVLEYEAEAERIQECMILFDKNSNDIFFYESDSDRILIQEYVNYEPSEQEKTVVKEENGVLTVTGKRRDDGIRFFAINHRDGYVKVYLPASYRGNLTASTVSGEISADMDFVLGEQADFQATTTSGDVNLLKVVAEHVDISTVSGELSVQEVSGDVRFSTTSGDIAAQKITGNMKLSTTSGEIRVAQGQGDCEAGSVSGDVELSALQGNFDISTTSGEVQITLPEGTAVDFDASSTSGEINTFFD